MLQFWSQFELSLLDYHVGKNPEDAGFYIFSVYLIQYRNGYSAGLGSNL